MRLPVLSIAVALWLAGCATAPPPRAPQPDLTVPGSWTAGSPAAAGTPDGDRWWQRFGDARLDDLIAEALTRNRDLGAAAARVAIAEANARIAGADPLPELSAGFDANRSKRNFIGFPIPGSEERVLSSVSTTLGVSLNVSWEADLWGRLRAGHVAALADARSAHALLAGARLSVAAQTAKAWFAGIEAAQQVALARRTLESRRTSTERVRRRYERGLRPSLDLRLARTAEASAEAALAARDQQLDAAIRQLEVLAGRYPARAVDPLVTLPALTEPVPAGLPADLISRRPDLVSAEMTLVSAGVRVSASRAALYPRLRLTSSGGTSTRELQDLLDGNFSVWSLVAGLAQPLFQGGRLRAGIAAAEARRDEAIASYAQRALEAYAEVETALAAERYLDQQADALDRAFAAAAGAERASEDRYARGLGTYLDVLESQRQALTAESQLLQVRRIRLSTRVDVHLALGGDFAIDDLDGPVDPALPPTATSESIP